MWADMKKNLKLAKMIKDFRMNIVKCIAKEYGMAIIEKALKVCDNILNGTAKGCPKTGIFSK